MAERTGRVSYGFLSGTATEKVTYGRGMTNKLTLNVGTFLTPDVPVTDYVDATDLLEEKEQAWQDDGGHANVVARNNAEKAWDIVAKKETGYVGRIAGSDEEIMGLGGCESTVTETNVTHKPNAILNGKVGVLPGVSGAAHFESDHDTHVVVDSFCYIVGTGTFNVVNDQLVMGAGAVMVGMKVDTHRKTDMTGLPVHQDLGVWIFGINSAGCGPISGPFPLFTL